MEPYDLEIGPIQRSFESLFKSINNYFQSALVVPAGSITETDLSTHSQKQLRKTLNASLKHYGFTELPSSMNIAINPGSHITGIHRSDNVTTYQERMKDGSYRTFNFYSAFGPENMKASFYWFNMKDGGEQTQGILTKDDKWYLRTLTVQGNVYYQRIDKEVHHL